MGLELDLDLELKLDLELNLQLESFLVQTYHLSAAAATLEVCILSGALSHQRTLLLSEVVYWQSSSCLNLWMETDSVD